MIGWICRNWAEVTILGCIIVFACWVFGYFAKGFYGLQFDLNSCWAGIAAISAGGVIALGKYWTDSTKNSSDGQMPSGGGGKC